MQKKILQVATISNTVNSFLIPHINMLQENGFSIDIACNICDPIMNEKFDKIVNSYDVPFQRNPLSKDNFKAFREIKNILELNKYDVVHVHTPVAAAVTRLAAKNLKNKPLIIYTAHGFHFYKGAPLKNWLMFYPIEKYLSKYTDILITINTEDYTFSKKHFSSEVKYVPGVGVNLDKFSSSLDIDSKNLLKKELGLNQNDFVLTCIGELNKNKNQEFLIETMKELPNNVKLLIVGKGSLQIELLNLSKKLRIEDRVLLLGFRSDIKDILDISDLLVTASIREGLPVNVIEAMAMGKPVISVANRGVKDLLENGKNGFIVEQDVLLFRKYINEIISNMELRKLICIENRNKAKQFSTEIVCQNLKEIYLEINNL